MDGWRRTLYHWFGGAKGPEVVERRSAAFFAVTCLVGAVIAGWLAVLYDPETALPAICLALALLGFANARRYLTARKQARPPGER